MDSGKAWVRIALFEFTNVINNGINSSKKVCELFLDITKLFDTVNHDTLMKKMYNYADRDVIYDWFRQCVIVNYVLSECGEVGYGMLQGSVLGATLFLIYINNLCNVNFKGEVFSFADDTAFCYIRNTQEEIKSDMNSDLQAIKWWFSENNMILSADKTKYKDFSLRGVMNHLDNILYRCLECMFYNRICLERCSEVDGEEALKYLGIT